MQRNGSFKFRGAYNKVANLAKKTVRAVVAVRRATTRKAWQRRRRHLRACPATIVMPGDAPA